MRILSSAMAVLTSRAEIMGVHKGDRERILCMKGALISIASIHRVHHVGHLLPGVSHGIFAFLSKFAAQPK